MKHTFQNIKHNDTHLSRMHTSKNSEHFSLNPLLLLGFCVFKILTNKKNTHF